MKNGFGVINIYKGKMDSLILSVLQNGEFAECVKKGQLAKFLKDINKRFMPILNDMKMALEDDDEDAIEEVLRELIKEWVEESQSD